MPFEEKFVSFVQIIAQLFFIFFHFLFKGTLMQIWNSSYKFVFI